MRTLALIHFCVFIPLGGLHADGIPKYKRSYFGGWADSDGDCQNTRHELLQELSTSIMSFTNNTCCVLTGKWLLHIRAKPFGSPLMLILIIWCRSTGRGNTVPALGVKTSECALRMIQETFLQSRNL